MLIWKIVVPGARWVEWQTVRLSERSFMWTLPFSPGRFSAQPPCIDDVPIFPTFPGRFSFSPFSDIFPICPPSFHSIFHRFPRCSQISYLFPRCFLDGSKLKTWGTTDFRFSWVSTIQLFGVPNDLIHSHVPMFISPKNFPNCPFLQGGAPPSYKLVYHLH